MTGNNTFLIDADKCTGCGLCVVACKDEHVGAAYAPWSAPQPDTGQFWIGIRALERGTAPRLRVTFLPVHCQHCASAPCIAACPDGAIKTRDDGLVWIDPGACTNCGLCAPACPYDVIYMNETLGVAQKCTGCAHRVDAGELPRCADMCPHEAILFGADADGEPYLPETGAAPRAMWRGLPRPWIAGQVTDAAGDEVIANAAITATELAGGGTATAASDAFGEFWLKGLERGRKYRVEIASDGYAPHVAIVTTDGDSDLGTVGLTRAV